MIVRMIMVVIVIVRMIVSQPVGDCENEGERAQGSNQACHCTAEREAAIHLVTFSCNRLN